MSDTPNRSAIATCSRCGDGLVPDDRFCGGCGAKVNGCRHCGNLLVAGDRACPQCGEAVDQSKLTAVLTKPGLANAPHAEWSEILAKVQAATIGELHFMTELGRGGMAAVYLAEDIRLRRKVAVKLILPELMADERMVRRFQEEASTVASLRHANIVRVFAVREAAGIHFFTMDYIEGRSLESILEKGGALPIPVVRSILAQVASALGQAHKQGVFHRDVKPANILIDTDGNAYVTDFGIAKVSDSDNKRQTLTQFGAVVGTPAYISPEQCLSRPVTGASDQYSLGVVAYEMVAGHQPFDDHNSFALMRCHTDEPVPPLRERRPTCPEDLATAIHRMLAKKPDERFKSMSEAITALGAQVLREDDPLRLSFAELATPGPLPPSAVINTPPIANAGAVETAAVHAAAPKKIVVTSRPPGASSASATPVPATPPARPPEPKAEKNVSGTFLDLPALEETPQVGAPVRAAAASAIPVAANAVGNRGSVDHPAPRAEPVREPPAAREPAQVSPAAKRPVVAIAAGAVAVVGIGLFFALGRTKPADAPAAAAVAAAPAAQASPDAAGGGAPTPGAPTNAADAGASPTVTGTAPGVARGATSAPVGPLVPVQSRPAAVATTSAAATPALKAPTNTTRDPAPAPPPVPAAVAKVETPAQEPPAAKKEISLPSGTQIVVTTTEEISSRTAAAGDFLTFRVAKPVTVSGKVVIAEGAVVKAVVSEANSAGHFGKGGSLSVKLETARTVDGQRVKLRAAQTAEGGESNMKSTVALTVLLGPAGLLRKGDDVVMKPGVEIKVFTDQDIRIATP